MTTIHDILNELTISARSQREKGDLFEQLMESKQAEQALENQSIPVFRLRVQDLANSLPSMGTNT